MFWTEIQQKRILILHLCKEENLQFWRETFRQLLLMPLRQRKQMTTAIARPEWEARNSLLLTEWNSFSKFVFQTNSFVVIILSLYWCRGTRQSSVQSSQPSSFQQFQWLFVVYDVWLNCVLWFRKRCVFVLFCWTTWWIGDWWAVRLFVFRNHRVRLRWWVMIFKSYYVSFDQHINTSMENAFHRHQKDVLLLVIFSNWMDTPVGNGRSLFWILRKNETPTHLRAD